MRRLSDQKIFQEKLLPAFAKEAGAVHYTWDMFTNLARPGNTQDRRTAVDYWQKKSAAGQECYDLWKSCISSTGKSQDESIQKLVKRLNKWYSKESANGLTQNSYSQGRRGKIAKSQIAADLEKLNEHCPNAAPWSHKSASLLLDRKETDNAIVAGIKEAFYSFYKANDWEALREWDQERRWFYKNKKAIDMFVKDEDEPKEAMLRLMQFSNSFDLSYREDFDRRMQ